MPLPLESGNVGLPESPKLFGRPSIGLTIPSPSGSTVLSILPSLLASKVDGFGMPLSFKSLIPSPSLSKSLKFGMPSPSVSAGTASPLSPLLDGTASAPPKIPSPSGSVPSTIPLPSESTNNGLPDSTKSLIPSLSLSKS